MAKVTFNEDKCKGCYLCVSVCPKKIITVAEHRLNAKGFKPVEVIDQEQCIGCASCSTMCPDLVITVEK